MTRCDFAASLSYSSACSREAGESVPRASRGSSRSSNEANLAYHFAPAICLVATLRRLKTLVVAIERIKAPSARSS
jgi:hypothetical protein